MTQPKHPGSLTEQVRAALDERTAQTDPVILARLDEARCLALDSRLAPNTAQNNDRPIPLLQQLALWLNRYTLVPAGSVAAAAIISMVWLGGAPSATHPEIQDFELLSADASLELLEELDFAEWLLFAEEEEGESAHVSG